jgi:N-acetylmuramoyl-L-alanine amidase
VRPHLVVLHYTAIPTAAETLARLCDPVAEVSCHWLIDRDGTLWSLVDETERAWHAGAGAWGGCSDVNSASIGVELVNTGAEPFPAPQMAALEGLLAGLLSRWAIPARGVIAHSDMAPARKSDPGRRFDWRRLALGGLAVWDPGGGADGDGDAPLARSLATIGYTDAAPDAALAAFRSRFRPGAEGPEAPEDRALAARLARAHPAV